MLRKFNLHNFTLSDRLDHLKRQPDMDIRMMGIEHLRVVLFGWWLGEAKMVTDCLSTAVQMLDIDFERPSEQYDRIDVAQHAHARALAHLMIGDDRIDLWTKAAHAYIAVLDVVNRADRILLAPGALLCSAMADVDPPQHIILSNDFAVSVLDIVSVVTDPMESGRRLYASRDILFATEPDLDLTTLFALLFIRANGLSQLATALGAAFIIDPDLALPPVMTTTGWSDKEGAMFVFKTLEFERLSELFALLSLSRDKDAIPQVDPPEFASWSRHPDLSLEVDLYAPAGEKAYLEIRGKGAGRLAAFLQESLDGTVRPGPEEALTELLTVPPRTAPANKSAAEARWEILCATIADENQMIEMPARALVSAGLADSDWRVRMVAVWAVGHYRIAGLAAKTEAAALPETTFKGLGQEDRRVLLALRDLAAARSAGRPDIVKSGANTAFVAKVASLIDVVPKHAGNRAEALLKVLLRCQLTNDDIQIPSVWKTWMKAISV